MSDNPSSQELSMYTYIYIYVCIHTYITLLYIYIYVHIYSELDSVDNVCSTKACACTRSQNVPNLNMEMKDSSERRHGPHGSV